MVLKHAKLHFCQIVECVAAWCTWWAALSRSLEGKLVRPCGLGLAQKFPIIQAGTGRIGGKQCLDYACPRRSADLTQSQASLLFSIFHQLFRFAFEFLIMCSYRPTFMRNSACKLPRKTSVNDDKESLYGEEGRRMEIFMTRLNQRSPTSCVHLKYSIHCSNLSRSGLR